MPMAVARFRGTVDVPLFRTAYDLSLSDYVGFPSGKTFSPHCPVPLFSYQPQSAALDRTVLERAVSVMPNINGASEALKNETQVAGVTGMTFRQNWIDGHLYTLNELPPSGADYFWRLSRIGQTRAAGQTVITTPPQWAITPTNPNVFPPQTRIEISHPPLGGFSNNWGRVPLMLYNWANDYSRVYSIAVTPYGLKAENAFSMDNLPTSSWVLFRSGSQTAFCNNRYVRNFSYGQNLAGGFGTGFENYMFVSKGTKASAYVLGFRTYDYDPDAIDLQEPIWDAVTFDNPIYADALDNPLDVQGWQGGFIFTLDTDGAGVTGLHQEVIVTNPTFTDYYVLRFIPQTPSAAEALIPENTNWTVKIDTEGTIWFHNGGAPGFIDALFYSFSPRLFFNPTLADFDLPALTMPCYNTCLPGFI